MKLHQWCWATIITVIGVALAVSIVWGWRQGGLVVLQLRGVC